MKKLFVILVLVGGLASCNESGTSINIKGDSLGKELDTLGNKIGEKAEQVWDSTKLKARDLKEGVEDRIDSARKD